MTKIIIISKTSRKMNELSPLHMTRLSFILLHNRWIYTPKSGMS